MIFISAPYTHHVDQVVEMRIKKVAQYCAMLLKDGKSCLTPLTAGSCILRYEKLPSDFQFWKKMSYDMLEVCDVVHVLMLDGWKESVGVTSEIDFAIANDVPIFYVDPIVLQIQ